MKKVGVFLLGTADLSGKVIGGQLEKTKIIYNALMEDEDITLSFCNMFQLKNKISLLWNVTRNYAKNQVTIVCASENGAKKIINLIYYLKKIFHKPVLFMVVGNQNNFIKNFNSKKLRCLDKCYFEIDKMQRDMSQYCNAGCFTNCKEIIKITNTNKNINFPIRICYYSEISSRKGFDKLVKILKEINMDKKRFELDVFGFFSNDMGTMKKIIKSNKNFISYKGVIKREKAYKILQQYAAMIFPSEHLFEGVPGAIVDVYEAGVPVISSDVSYMSSIVHEGITGYIFHDKDELKKILIGIYHNPNKLIEMSKNCLEEAKIYDIHFAYKKLKEEILFIINRNNIK